MDLLNLKLISERELGLLNSSSSIEQLTINPYNQGWVVVVRSSQNLYALGTQRSQVRRFARLDTLADFLRARGIDYARIKFCD